MRDPDTIDFVEAETGEAYEHVCSDRGHDYPCATLAVRLGAPSIHEGAVPC